MVTLCPWWAPDIGWWVFVYTSEVLARKMVSNVIDALAQGLVTAETYHHCSRPSPGLCV